MISRLGVSKAVLDNVIFCHQEDSTWYVVLLFHSQKMIKYLSSSLPNVLLKDVKFGIFPKGCN